MALLMATTLAWAQQPVKVETFRLKNGLKVIMCEEHSQPKVHGCVVVHAGSKNENPNATGVAHYFEHIMFKGTDRIGTTNWKAEKLYLDSISQAYDRLQATKDAQERHDIQLEIYRLNIAASEYAIPNEVDAILQKMGCTGLNAGTSFDYTVYFNTLPSNQLTNWMDVYVERFRNPVFRLFQSELEAVYEEKNMYENQMGSDFSRNLFRESFGSHPYSRDVIGLAEHLKNPQPSEMQKFFDTYYVANNMALILVGDFNSAEARKLVESKFSTWRSGELPQRPTYDMPTFAERKVLEVKQTPIKMGMMVFAGVNNSHPDGLPLNMLASILGGGSGLLDEAVSHGRLMMAQLMPLSLEEAGSNVIMYVPNIVGQSFDDAEKVIWDCIDSIKQGRFTDELMQSIKNASLVNNQRMVEDYRSLSQLLLQLELENRSYDDWLRENQRWMDLTRDEIIEVANKYFDKDHCTLVHSKMGFPSHDAAVKPDWDHLEAKNQNAQSPFAKMIAENRPDPIRPEVIDFDRDVTITDLNNGTKLYSVANPKNDVFELSIDYHYGEIDNHDLARAFEYLDLVGPNGMTRQEYIQVLGQFGGSASVVCGNGYSTLNIVGLEQNIDTIVALTAAWLHHPAHDSKQIKIIVDELKAAEKAAKSSSDEWFSALRKYVTYGEKSPNLWGTPYKEWGKRTGEQLHEEAMQIFDVSGSATFSGNTDPENLRALLSKHGLVRDNVKVVPLRAVEQQVLDKSQVYYCHNKKFLQSDIIVMMPSGKFDMRDMGVSSLFNEYFGGGMNSVVFQEIREFRSLGYSTYGYFDFDVLNRNPSKLFCFLGTQCDKTQEGVEALRDLMVNLPERKDKLAGAVESEVLVRNSEHHTFRTIPAFVEQSKEVLGWNRDMRAEITGKIACMTMDDLKSFHNRYVKDRPMIVIISGNAKKFKVKEVAKLLGENTPVTAVKFKQMFKF